MGEFRRTAAQRAVRRPHLYAVAELAHRAVQQQQCSASVIVSGESGAGKTEASKHLLRYLSWRAGGASGSAGVAARILHSTPIFEAFGNARTPFNDNSSRFGKHMEVRTSSQVKSSQLSSAQGQVNEGVASRRCAACLTW